jgi:hypothetical protein
MFGCGLGSFLGNDFPTSLSLCFGTNDLPNTPLISRRTPLLENLEHAHTPCFLRAVLCFSSDTVSFGD